MRRLTILGTLCVTLFVVSPSTSASAAAEPWVGFSWNMGGSYRDVALTVSMTATKMTISAGESLPWAKAYGCTIPTDTVVYDFTLVGKNSAGYNLYNGLGLGWTASGGVCSTTGLSGQWSAVLEPGRNGFLTPPLAYGVDNVISVYLGTYNAGDGMPTGADNVFYRKGGTMATTTTTTVVGDLGEADDEKPEVEALASKGKRGTAVGLRFTSSDDSGEAREQLAVYKGKKVVGRVSTSLGERDPDETYTVAWTGKKTIYGKLRFCVVGIDEAGNKSKESCAALTLLK